MVRHQEIQYGQFRTERVGWGRKTLEDLNVYYTDDARGRLVAEKKQTVESMRCASCMNWVLYAVPIRRGAWFTAAPTPAARAPGRAF